MSRTMKSGRRSGLRWPPGRRGRCVTSWPRSREQLGERPGGVQIVVDDQDPDRRARPGRGAASSPAGCGWGAVAGSRTMNSLPWPGPSLVADHAPPCSSTRLLTRVSPTPEAALRPGRATVALGEKSNISGSISAGSRPVVPHPDDDWLLLATGGEPDLAAGVGVLGGVGQEIDDDLFQAGRVGLDPAGARRRARRRARGLAHRRAAGPPRRRRRATREASRVSGGARSFPG